MNRLSFLKRISTGFFALFIPQNAKGDVNKKRYFLTKFYVAGFYYYDGETVVNKLKVGDELLIVQEPTNPYDRRALEIFTTNNIKLGYVPRNENPIPSRLLRQNVTIIGTVDKINPDEEDWKKVRINLFAEV
ncbi:MAG TPA: HIRAN domain-containing protein [Ignavibacteriaceae bacterium]|nr:HIRAN domain-containing protein [Ignavibacteriaceae bacterium]